MRLANNGLRDRDDFGAVDHVVHVVAEGVERGEDELEVFLELGLVVWWGEQNIESAEQSARRTAKW